MKKRILIIGLIVLVLVLVIICAILHGNESTINNGEKLPDNVIVPKLQILYRNFDNCLNQGDPLCKDANSIYFRIDDLNQNPDLVDIINTVNSVNLNRGENLPSELNTISECPEQAKIYKTRFSEQGNIYFYYSDSIVVITQDLISKDVCTDITSNLAFNVYYYDVKWQKLRDQEWLLKALKLKKTDIDKIIVDSLVDDDIVKDKEEYNTLISEHRVRCELYLDMVADLYARYIDISDNSYKTIKIKTRDELGLPLPS